MDYYKKNVNNTNNCSNRNKNLDIILEEKNKEGDELSGIPSSADIKKYKINNNINKNVNNNKNINYTKKKIIIIIWKNIFNQWRNIKILKNNK